MKKIFSSIIPAILLFQSCIGFSQDQPPGSYSERIGATERFLYNETGSPFSSDLEETGSQLKMKQRYGSSGFGARLSIGTDITLGIGFGVGAFYILAPSRYGGTNWDLGFDIYYANVTEEETDSEGTKFEDNTKVVVFALRSNGLFNYHPKRTGVYFVAGAGIVFANIDWEENITYYEPYLPHTERWSDDVFAVGNVLNLGVGMTFGGGLEARFETPLLIFYSAPGHASRSAGSVAPTFTLSLLYRFP